MEDFFFNCPVCHNEIKAKTSWRGKTAECPFCKSNCVVPLENSAVPPVSTSAEMEYKAVILEIKSTGEMSRELNKYASEGWHVVSQSTVFLSETSGLMGLSGGTRQEGILYTLCRKNPHCSR